jgi:hypothetical protein
LRHAFDPSCRAFSIPARAAAPAASLDVLDLLAKLLDGALELEADAGQLHVGRF